MTAYVHTRPYKAMQAFVHACMQTYMHVCIHKQTNKQTNTQTNTHTHILSHTCIHTHRHTGHVYTDSDKENRNPAHCRHCQHDWQKLAKSVVKHAKESWTDALPRIMQMGCSSVILALALAASTNTESNPSACKPTWQVATSPSEFNMKALAGPCMNAIQVPVEWRVIQGYVAAVECRFLMQKLHTSAVRKP